MRSRFAAATVVMVAACSPPDDRDADSVSQDGASEAVGSSDVVVTPLPQRAERVPVSVVGAWSADGLTVGIDVDSCNRSPSVVFEEFDDRVEVAAVADPPSLGDQPACGDGVTIELSEHVGTRPVVDADGRRIEVDLGRDQIG